MNEVLNQIRRIFSDNGKGDKDFTQEEIKLKKALDELKEATRLFTNAASVLSDTIRSRLPEKH